MNWKFFFLSLIIVFITASHLTMAQDTIQTYKNHTQIQTGALISTANRLPFWLHTNQHGLVPKNAAYYLRFSTFGVLPVSSQNDDLKITYGLSTAINFATNSSGTVAQIYGGVKYKQWDFYVGRRNETFGLCDSTLSSGSYSWSGNSLPVPKIQIANREYITIPKTKGWLAFRGNFAHGWFGQGFYTKNTLFHQKTFYLRIGKPSSPFRLYGGFNHQVVWAGSSEEGFGLPAGETAYPKSFKSYLNLVTGARLDSSNRVGNHLGSIDVGMSYELSKVRLDFYRQNFYEDGSLYFLTNLADGLLGVTITRLFAEPEPRTLVLSKVVVEYLSTKSQGGSIFVIEEGRQRGRDNYFNNFQYRDGWFYRGRGIGTPFITNRNDTKVTDRQNGYESANNNRVSMLHFGVSGYYGRYISWASKISISKNFGTYDYPYTKVPQQVSAWFEANGHLPVLGGFNWVASVALDAGELYEDSVGFQIGIQKKWTKK